MWTFVGALRNLGWTSAAVRLSLPDRLRGVTAVTVRVCIQPIPIPALPRVALRRIPERRPAPWRSARVCVPPSVSSPPSS